MVAAIVFVDTMFYAAIAPLLPHHNAILLTHHGALTVGDTLLRAFMRMEQVEHT